jgi:hypothetical protein
VIAPKFSMIVDSVNPIRELAVPEPATWVLLVVGFVWVSVARKRTVSQSL